MSSNWDISTRSNTLYTIAVVDENSRRAEYVNNLSSFQMQLTAIRILKEDNSFGPAQHGVVITIYEQNSGQEYPHDFPNHRMNCLNKNDDESHNSNILLERILVDDATNLATLWATKADIGLIVEQVGQMYRVSTRKADPTSPGSQDSRIPWMRLSMVGKNKTPIDKALHKLGDKTRYEDRLTALGQSLRNDFRAVYFPGEFGNILEGKSTAMKSNTRTISLRPVYPFGGNPKSQSIGGMFDAHQQSKRSGGSRESSPVSRGMSRGWKGARAPSPEAQSSSEVSTVAEDREEPTTKQSTSTRKPLKTWASLFDKESDPTLQLKTPDQTEQVSKSTDELKSAPSAPNTWASLLTPSRSSGDSVAEHDHKTTGGSVPLPWSRLRHAIPKSDTSTPKPASSPDDLSEE